MSLSELRQLPRLQLVRSSCAKSCRAVPEARQNSAIATRTPEFERWSIIRLVLLSLSATLARYFDNGPPASRPHLERATTEGVLARTYVHRARQFNAVGRRALQRG
jgi:hypothetical protein